MEILILIAIVAAGVVIYLSNRKPETKTDSVETKGLVEQITAKADVNKDGKVDLADAAAAASAVGAAVVSTAKKAASKKRYYAKKAANTVKTAAKNAAGGRKPKPKN